ncbi:hypothetical protein [Ancylobacter sp. FA202]|uniref:hypothetical protein n=1 Tax=Ancylobacter sp. FA202 TaxID=1111106 RepID=UPI000476B1D4|nr:hypothetical protein [Ancylobacter sp. FA202]
MNRRQMLIAGAGGAAAATGGWLGWRGVAGSASAYERYSAALRAPLRDDPPVLDLIRTATLASGSPTLPDWLGARAFDLFVTPAAENEKYARQIDSSPGIAIFFAEQADRAHWIEVGRACQRFALAATAQGRSSHASIRRWRWRGCARNSPRSPARRGCGRTW